MFATSRHPAMPYTPPAVVLWSVDQTRARPVVRRGAVEIVPTVCTKPTPVDAATCLAHAERLAAALNRVYGRAG